MDLEWLGKHIHRRLKTAYPIYRGFFHHPGAAEVVGLKMSGCSQPPYFISIGFLAMLWDGFERDQTRTIAAFSNEILVLS
jgi:hypothetical protein